MKKISIIGVVCLVFILIIAGLLYLAKNIDVSASVSDSTFLNGELNPDLKWQGVRVIGTVIQIKDGINESLLYKVDPEMDGVKPIWVSSFVPVAEGRISVDDRLVFKGYITSVEYMDPTGKLESLINSSHLLRARTIETP